MLWTSQTEKNLNNLPANCMLVFFDVVVLYRRLPQEEEEMSNLSFGK